MSPTHPDPLIGRLIDGRYQVRSRIARGGMATVYLATDLRLERRVAIKIMHGHLSDDTDFRSRFIQEARSAARLSHPNVVNVYDQGQDSDMAYLVMEYLPGITLRDLLRDYGRLTAEQTFDIMRSVLSGLAAAHSAGIMHRDLKPENVLLADDGRIKLGDFGLARAAANNTSTGRALLGTIAYLSPELVTRGIADARSDVYALGIMMFEMLTGEQPFHGEQPMQIAYQHANDSVPAPSSLNPEVPGELDELVLWATARDPEHRARDAGELLDQLRLAERGLQGPAPATNVQPTMVLPAHAADEAGETQILNPADEVRAEAGATEPVAVLARSTRRRRGKGWILFLVVMLVAALGAGTGWYFGSGPGSFVEIPEVGSSPPAAAAALEKLGFEVTTDKVYSTTVSAGDVVGTDPAAGERALKGSEVTLLVSNGRKPITVPKLAGLALDDAKKAITGAGATVGEIHKQFDADVDAGHVLSAQQAAGEGKDLSGGGDYLFGLPVDLVVSAGAVPDVAGSSLAEAEKTLKSVGLATAQGQKSYSDSVPEGHVIAATPEGDGPVRPGDTIYLETSKGPRPIPVPNVVGQSWSSAKQTLIDAGFELDYNENADNAPMFAIVTETDPSAGTAVPKGTTVHVTFLGE